MYIRGNSFQGLLDGSSLTLITDHQPLLALFKENKDIPSHASGRIQRCALAGFEYTFTARSTTARSTIAHGNADALSRLPLIESIETPPVPPKLILTLEQIAESPITNDKIHAWTTKDTVLQQVVQFIQHGWPNHCSNPELKPYWSHRTELHSLEGCICGEHEFSTQ